MSPFPSAVLQSILQDDVIFASSQQVIELSRNLPEVLQSLRHREREGVTKSEEEPAGEPD
jgi:hypothetical protein